MTQLRVLAPHQAGGSNGDGKQASDEYKPKVILLTGGAGFMYVH